MKDARTEVLRSLVTMLSTIGLDVLSMVPDNHPMPYIFIGDMVFTELENKSKFRTSCDMVVEVVSGDNEWLGSIAPLNEYYNKVKQMMQPYKGFTFPVTGFDMTYLRLESDNGIEQVTDVYRLYSGALVYNCELSDYSFYDRVIDDGGTMEVWSCVVTGSLIPEPPPPDPNTYVTFNSNQVTFNGINIIYNG